MRCVTTAMLSHLPHGCFSVVAFSACEAGPSSSSLGGHCLSLQVVDVAPELLRICSVTLAENKIPPGEGGWRGGGGAPELGAART